MQISVRDNNKYELVIDKSIYNLDVLHKCFYWYTGDFNVDISEHDDTHFAVSLTAASVEHIDVEGLLSKIQRDLIDFKLRDIVTKDTQNIRDLIVAKAFANYDTDADEPEGEISDPVGFNPALI